MNITSGPPNSESITKHVYDDVSAGAEPSRGFLLILAGLPYSGKSTLAADLQRHGFIHIWLTVIKKRYHLEDSEALSVAEAVIERLLNEGYGVAFDFLNHTESLRRRFITTANRAKVPYKIVWFDAGMDEIYKRQRAVMEEGGSEGRSVISREVIETIRQEMQVPEGHDVIMVKQGGGEEVSVAADVIRQVSEARRQ